MRAGLAIVAPARDVLCSANVADTTMTGYVLGELLGKGGMGAVYAAQQPSLGRTVAIKLLHPELAADPSIVERFRTEALAGSRLSHPNVAGVIDFGVTAEGTPYLVMEHVAGERLACILEREGALALCRASMLVCQLLAALDAAHAAGVVHADVKSDNVLVSVERDGRETATLIDFGIARLADRAPLDDGPVLSGTPEYLAPEIIAGAPPTMASDIYSAGIVLYELLTGETPFQGGSSTEVFRRHLDEDVIAPSLRCPEVEISPALDRVVLRALAKDPTMRFASAAQFAAALAAAIPTTAQSHRPRTDRPRLGFSTEALTQDWPVSPRRRVAEGTRPQPTSRAERLRSAIGAAIIAGDPDAIAGSYLDLARALVAARREDVAAEELEQAVDVLTAGDGPGTATPPSRLWGVLLALAAIYERGGESTRAHAIALHARTAALDARSAVGLDRAHALLSRLSNDIAA